MNTNVLERLDLSPQDQDDEHLAHYTDAASATEGYVMGTPILTLCGITLIPHRNPEKLKVCPECKEILDSMFPNGE